MRESLIEYVRRIMDQKNFGVRDVERNSGKKITASHVSKVLNGSAGNLTADKIVGLALGLKVDPHELFSVISGYQIKDRTLPDLLPFINLIQQVAMNPVLFEILQELARLTTRDQARTLEMVKFANSRKQKPEHKKKKH